MLTTGGRPPSDGAQVADRPGGHPGTGDVEPDPAGGVNGAVRLCKGERQGRTLAVTMGAVVLLAAVVVVGLIVAASVLMFRRDVQEFLARS